MGVCVDAHERFLRIGVAAAADLDSRPDGGGAGKLAREGAWPGPRCQGASLRRDAEVRAALDVGEAAGEAFALGIDQRGGAGARDRIDTARATGIRPASTGRITRASMVGIVRRAALPGVAIAFDQPRAFGDFERQRRGPRRRRDDQPEPGLDRRLLLAVAVAARPQPAQLGQHQEAQIAGDRSGVDFHAPMEAAEPTPAFGEAQDRGGEPRRQELAEFLDAGLEEFDDRDRLAGLAAPSFRRCAQCAPARSWPARRGPHPRRTCARRDGARSRAAAVPSAPARASACAIGARRSR